MGWQDTTITILILLMIFVIGYCRITHKSLVELVQEIREIFSPVEEVSKL